MHVDICWKIFTAAMDKHVPSELTIETTLQFIIADFKQRRGMSPSEQPLVIICVDEIFKLDDPKFRTTVVSFVAGLQDRSVLKFQAVVVPILTSLYQSKLERQLYPRSNRALEVRFFICSGVDIDHVWWFTALFRAMCSGLSFHHWNIALGFSRFLCLTTLSQKH